jgi:sugar phosphate isomerase/epimerase
MITPAPSLCRLLPACAALASAALLYTTAFLWHAPSADAAPPTPSTTLGTQTDLFRKENLAAWCIVPFDKSKRTPEQRAAMLEQIGLRKFVHDYRAEHVPFFEDEIVAMKAHGIEVFGWMFSPGTDPKQPDKLNAQSELQLELFEKHGIQPQLWVIKGGGTIDPGSPEEQEKRVSAEVASLRTAARIAASKGLKIGLYNHGGWFGEPENQIAIIERLRSEGFQNVGIVYNLHHGHGHLARFPQMLQQMLPYLICLNLNGMDIAGDQHGRKILPLGAGTEDLAVLRTIRDSGYRGPIGILNHTGEDAEERLLDNLDGLTWLTTQLAGKPSPTPPAYRSWKSAPATPKPAAP